ncbi:MAG TPA: hypothetical protein PKD05_20775, partial [Candidatus Melainabacteria bacterium]|nr:hypothetical protein [Candidatus Melainabacteria bacterium]
RSSILISLIFTMAFFLVPHQGITRVIQAEIEHKDYLPGVPETFSSGAVLNTDKLEKRVEWFPVPDWMAGTYTKEGDMETFEKDFRSGSEKRENFWLENRVTLSFGHQRDALNTIWHAEVLPFRADGTRGRSRDQRYVIGMSCLKSTPESVVLKFHSVVVALDDRDRVLGSKQQEEIVSFFPGGGDNFITTTSSTKTFSESGQPLYQLDSHTKRLRTRGFMEEDYLSGIDLKRSLNDFLIGRDMQNRLVRAR